MRSISFHVRVFTSLIIKVFSAVALFLLTRVLLKNVTAEDFAIISVLLSIFSWFLAIDLGVGSALRNSIGSSCIDKNRDIILFDIRNAFQFLMIVALVGVVFTAIVLFALDLKNIFHSMTHENGYLYLATIVMVVSSFLSLPFIAFKSWLLATHKNEIESFQNLLFYIIPLLLLIVFFGHYGELSLVELCFILSISYFISNNIYLLCFMRANKQAVNLRFLLTPSLGFNSLKQIISRSYTFFFIQLSGLLIYSTGTFLVNLYTGSDSTTLYVLLMRIISVPLLVSNVVMSFYWSKMTTLYFSNAKDKANKLTLKLMFLLSLLFLILFLFYFCAGDVVHFVFAFDTDITKYKSLIAIVCFYGFLTAANNLWGTALSAIGKTRFGMASAFVAAIVNIPLGYYFSSVLGYGAFGVVLGTIVVLIPGVFISPFQYYLFYVSKDGEYEKLKVIFS